MEMAGSMLDQTVADGAALRRAGLVAVARWLRLDAPAFTDADRVAALKRRAVAPGACGPDMPAAPARGRLLPVQPIEMVRVKDGYAPQHVGHAGRDAGRAADAFDRIADQAKRAGGADPFTPAQKDTGRAYAALVERHACVGLKGRSIEVARGGGGGGDGVMDLILDEGRRIVAMERAACAIPGLQVKRARGARQPITALSLVRAVCVEGLDLGGVLRRHGWACYGGARHMASQVLASALDAMADRR